MQLTYKQAVELPVYYQVTYQIGFHTRHFAYFDNKPEAEQYATTILPPYRITAPCHGDCSRCHLCIPE